MPAQFPPQFPAPFPAQFPDEAEIERVTRAMLACRLPKAEWTHAAHWAGALWLLRHAPDQAATMGEAIRAYNLSVGGQNTDSSGYHETITIASLRAAAAHLARYRSATDLASILADLLASHLGHPEWLLAYWRRETLFGAQARRHWVEPDLGALPF